MATLSQLPGTLNLACSVGNDFTLTLAVTENGSTWSSTGATLATVIQSRDGTTLATNFTSSATDGQVTLTLTDTNTTTLGVGVYRYWLSVTKSSNTRTWIAGTLSVVELSVGASSSAASLSITTGTVSLSLTTLTAPAPVSYALAATGVAATDTANLQTAITNASGKTLVIPAGSYVTNASLTIPSNTHVQMLDGCTITLAASSNCDIFTNSSWASGNSNIRISGGYLNGNRLNQTGVVGDGPGQSLITLVNVTGFRIEGVRGTSPFLHGIDCSVRDIAANSFGDPGCSAGAITGCEFTDFGDDGITTHWSQGITITGCVCFGAAASYSGSSNGFELDDGSQNITLSACVSYDNRSGFMVQGHSGRIPARRITITGCVAYDNERAGYICSQPTSAHGTEAARMVTITGCVSENNYYGLQIENYRTVIVDGLVIDTATHGYYLDETITGTLRGIRIRGGEMLSATNPLTLAGTAAIPAAASIRDVFGYVATDEKVWVPSGVWKDTVGSPIQSITLASGKSLPVWLLDAAAGSENITTALCVPDGWATVDVEVWWTEPSGGTGDVVWRMDRAVYGDGESTNAETTGANVTATAPAQYTIKATTLLTGITVDPTKLLRLEILRLGSNASDTLANDAAVLGAMLRRKT